MRRLITILLFIVVLVVGAGFSAINTIPTTVNYYLGEITLPLSIIVILSIVLGLFLGATIIFSKTLGLRYENRHLKKNLSVSKQEVDSLRVLPLKDES